MKKSFYLEQAKEMGQYKVVEERFSPFFCSTTSDNASYNITTENTKENFEELKKAFSTADSYVEKKGSAFPFEIKPETNNLARTFTSYSGADMVFGFEKDGVVEPIGEIQSIYYSKVSPLIQESIANSDYYDAHLVKDYPVTILIEVALFDKEQDIKDGHNIMIMMADEYGNASHQIITEVHKLFELSGMSVDSIFMTKKYVLCAKNISLLIKDR